MFCAQFIFKKGINPYFVVFVSNSVFKKSNLDQIITTKKAKLGPDKNSTAISRMATWEFNRISTFFGLFLGTSGGHLINSQDGHPINSLNGWLIQQKYNGNRGFVRFALWKTFQVDILTLWGRKGGHPTNSRACRYTKFHIHPVWLIMWSRFSQSCVNNVATFPAIKTVSPCVSPIFSMIVSPKNALIMWPRSLHTTSSHYCNP